MDSEFSFPHGKLLKPAIFLLRSVYSLCKMTYLASNKPAVKSWLWHWLSGGLGDVVLLKNTPKVFKRKVFLSKGRVYVFLLESGPYDWLKECGGSDAVPVSGTGFIKLAASIFCLLRCLLTKSSWHAVKKPNKSLKKPMWKETADRGLHCWPCGWATLKVIPASSCCMPLWMSGGSKKGCLSQTLFVSR